MIDETKDILTEQPQEETALDMLAEQPEEPKKEEVKESAAESQQKENFRRIKEDKEKAERERDELMRMMTTMNQNQQNQYKQYQPQEEQTNLNPDDLVEWKHVQKELAKRDNDFKTYKEQTQQTVIRSQLRSQYNDFDKVVNQETIKALQKEYPEVAATIDSSTDIYATGVSAYTLIKRLGIYQDDTFNADKERIQSNAAKPRSAATVGGKASASPLGNVGAFEKGLTEDLKDKLYKEMVAYRNQG